MESIINDDIIQQDDDIIREEQQVAIVDDIGYNEKYELRDGKYGNFVCYPDEIIHKYIPKSKNTTFITIPAQYIEKFSSLQTKNVSISNIFNKALAFFFMADKNEIVYYLNIDNDEFTLEDKGPWRTIRIYEEYFYNCRKFFKNNVLGYKRIAIGALKYTIKNLEKFISSFSYLPPYYNFLEYVEAKYEPKYIEKSCKLKKLFENIGNNIFTIELELNRGNLSKEQTKEKEKILKILKLKYECFFTLNTKKINHMVDKIAQNETILKYDARIYIPDTWYKVIINQYQHYNKYNYFVVDKKDAIQKLITLYHRQIDVPNININDIKEKTQYLKMKRIRIKRKLLKSLQAHLYHIKSELTPYEWILKAFYILSNYQRYDINISIMLDNIYEKEYFDFGMLNKSEQLEFDDKIAHRFLSICKQNIEQVKPQINQIIKGSDNA